MIYAEGIDEPNMFDKCACLWLLEDVTDREQQIVQPMEPDCLPTGRKYALILNYTLNSCMNDDNLICVLILESKFSHKAECYIYHALQCCHPLSDYE